MEQIPVVQDFTPDPVPNGKFHVRLTKGRFQNIRRFTSWPLIALFFGLVWIQWDGQPWLLFSFEQHRIFLFGHTLSWRDLPILAGLLIASAALLFFLAVAWGRVWCGFACPQSIWTWVFIRIEDLTEGKANKRARQEREALTAQRLIRRFTKHFLWLLVALATALTFTGYFLPIREIVADAVQWNLSASVSGWILMMAGLTYLNAGLVREKICLHACPYSRFQSVMFDRQTQTVSYDVTRGEPRANQRKGKGSSGDCIDCGLCVQVCPVGIDIRDGLQAACIDCAACIDACDNVMSKIARPRGLIRFASEAQFLGEKGRILRPRLIGYGALLILSVGAVVYSFTQTTQLLVEIRRDRGAMFRQMGNHTVCNVYLVKVEGYSKEQKIVDVSISGDADFKWRGARKIDLAQDNDHWLPYRICTQDPKSARMELRFNFRGDLFSTSKITTFLSPVR